MNQLILRGTLRLLPTSGLPDGDATAPGDLGTRMNEIVGTAKWGAIVVCLLAFIVGAATWAMQYRPGGHGGDGGVGKLVVACVATALISGSVGIVGFFV